MQCRQMAGFDLPQKRSTPAPPLPIDAAETTETKIERLIMENSVIVFSRSSCCICHVMRRLLSTIGTHPTVIELEDEEIESISPGMGSTSEAAMYPIMFIGGAFIGGLENLMALHLSGLLVPRLVEVGALLRWCNNREIFVPSATLKDLPKGADAMFTRCWCHDDDERIERERWGRSNHFDSARRYDVITLTQRQMKREKLLESVGEREREDKHLKKKQTGPLKFTSKKEKTGPLK